MSDCVAIITYRVDSTDPDPFVELTHSVAGVATGISWLRDQIPLLLAADAIYVVAAQVFTSGGTLLEELAPWDLAGKPKPGKFQKKSGPGSRVRQASVPFPKKKK